MKSRQLSKPEDQLDLTEAELAEEITKVLTPTNTNVVHNLVVYSFKDEAFVPVRIFMEIVKKRTNKSEIKLYYRYLQLVIQ